MDNLFKGAIVMANIDNCFRAVEVEQIQYGFLASDCAIVKKHNNQDKRLYTVEKLMLCGMPIHKATLRLCFGVDDFGCVGRIRHKTHDVFVECENDSYMLGFQEKIFKTYALKREPVKYISDIQRIIMQL